MIIQIEDEIISLWNEFRKINGNEPLLDSDEVEEEINKIIELLCEEDDESDINYMDMYDTD